MEEEEKGRRREMREEGRREAEVASPEEGQIESAMCLIK